MHHRPSRGLLKRGSLAVPAIVCGAWALAAAQDGAHSGQMTPFLLSLAAILVAAFAAGVVVNDDRSVSAWCRAAMWA